MSETIKYLSDGDFKTTLDNFNCIHIRFTDKGFKGYTEAIIDSLNNKTEYNCNGGKLGLKHYPYLMEALTRVQKAIPRGKGVKYPERVLVTADTKLAQKADIDLLRASIHTIFSIDVIEFSTIFIKTPKVKKDKKTKSKKKDNIDNNE